MSVLWSARGIVFGVHVGILDAGLGTAVVRRSVPDAFFEQLHAAEFLDYDTTPVRR